MRMYSELAPWFHHVTHPDEAAHVARLSTAACRGAAKTLLELGSGGGNNASHLKAHFSCTLTDVSPDMLALSRTLNPECEHIVGDMRTLRLEQLFDIVFVHDAINYMTTEADLRAAIATAAAHIRPGGAAIFMPDAVTETFAPGAEYGGRDGVGGRGLRFLGWTHELNAHGVTYDVDYVLLIHEPDRADLPFPHSLPEFQRLFPDDAACAAYLEKARWGDGFACPHCGTAGEPFHFENRPGDLRCRKCRQNTGLTVGTVMERSHTPLNVWFWAAYLVASQTPGMSAVQFQRQLGLSRYETAFQILHKLRSGMVRPNQDRIGGQPKNHVEVDETWVGGRTRGEGRGVHHKVPVSCAIEVRHRKPGTKLDNRKDGRYAGRVRLAVVLDRSAESLCGFVESTVAPGIADRY